MFVRLIFVVLSLRRKFFHAELFPNYGMSITTEKGIAGINDPTMRVKLTVRLNDFPEHQALF